MVRSLTFSLLLHQIIILQISGASIIPNWNVENIFYAFFKLFENLIWFFFWQPQGDHIELHRKRNGYRLDYFERKRKKAAREVHERSKYAQKVIFVFYTFFFFEIDYRNVFDFADFDCFNFDVEKQALGIKGKMFAKKRYAEKALMKKT